MDVFCGFCGFLTTTRLVLLFLFPLSLTDLAFFWISTIPVSSTYLRRKLWSLIFLFIWILITMPMKRCCACNKTRADNIILHTFPNPDKEPVRFKQWVNAIGGDLLVIGDRNIFDLYRVCHSHFGVMHHTWSKRLSPNAVPTLFLRGSQSIPAIREVLQDITNEVQPQPSSSSTVPAVLSFSSQSTLSTPNPVTTLRSKTSKRSTYRKKETVELCKKIKYLQKSKATVTKKLKRALILSHNASFQKALKNFTSAASMFTQLQFREVNKKKAGRRYTKNEKVLALALLKQGPRAYRWLRRFFVLPSPLTLSRMISKAALKPGLNENLFQEFKKKVNVMKEDDKLCVLLFDEMALTPHFDYVKRRDCISGFVDNGEVRKSTIADHALVFMVRGIFKNYKQPVSYTFCASTTPALELVTLMKAVIRKLHTIGLKVMATVCDQGATNVSAINWLIKETRLSNLRKGKVIKNNIFEIDDMEVVPLYDPPHLIKGIRNNLLKSHLKANINGRDLTAKWDHIVKLYEKDGVFQGIRLMPRLTDRHVVPRKISKMKVKCATQVFSRTVAGQMGSLAKQGVLPQECEETAIIIKFFDELFDSVNGSFHNYNKSGKTLLGPVTPTCMHKKTWADAKKVLSSMKFLKKDGRSGFVPSIKNWLVTIDNIEYLVGVLQKNYKLTSLWMRHFNQDPLENFFGSIRSHGYRNNSPSCAAFESAFAALLINNLSSVHSRGFNCEQDSCIIFKSLKRLFFCNAQVSACVTEVDFEDVFNDHILKKLEDKRSNPNIRAQLDYVTGYVLRKLRIKCPKCRECLYSQDNTESTLSVREYIKNKTCLTYPSLKLINNFSNIQDVVINILTKKSSLNNIMLYVKTILSVVIDYSFIQCNIHKEDIITQIEKIALNFFVYNWCKDTNKILIGNRTQFDDNDSVQKMSYNYCQKFRYKK